MSVMESILIRTWKFVLSKGNTELASEIASLLVIEPSKPAMDASPRRDSGYRIPSGKFRGKRIADLSDGQLQNVWSGFNGCGNHKVANVLKAELRLRGIE